MGEASRLCEAGGQAGGDGLRILVGARVSEPATNSSQAEGREFEPLRPLNVQSPGPQGQGFVVSGLGPSESASTLPLPPGNERHADAPKRSDAAQAGEQVRVSPAEALVALTGLAPHLRDALLVVLGDPTARGLVRPLLARFYPDEAQKG